MNRRSFLTTIAGGAMLGAASLSPLLQNSAVAKGRAPIKAICFDAFPLFDPRAIFSLVKTLVPDQGETFSEMWFNKIFAYSWLRNSGDQYTDFTSVIADALNYTSTRLAVDLSNDTREQLTDIWYNLQLWPDARAAIESFSEQGIKLAFLSNLTEKMLRANTRRNGVEDQFEIYLSTDNVRAFKPSPRAYQMGVDAFELPKENIAFAAFGAWDAVGASWFGYPTVWVNRFDRPAENLDSGAITSGRDISVLTNFVKA